MDSSVYKKILIFGQPFNNSTGGGITLTNLFKGWSKDNIAVLFEPWDGDAKINTDICCIYYQIGKEEHRWRFPFNLYKQRFPQSGLIKDANYCEASACSYKTSLKHKQASRILNHFIEWLGMHHCYSQITLSDRLTNWLTEFHPEILYLQVSSLETITFACQLINILKIPSIIHMMDDWPSTISMYGILKKYWGKKIDKEFRILLKKVNIHLSISDAMSDEYQGRYNVKFIPFHNPIETKLWLPFSKTNFSLNKRYIIILFSGRIGTGISDSLLEVASAIDLINKNDNRIKFHIQTTVIKHPILGLLQKFKCVVINPVAEYKHIPEIFSKADILLLANDFSAKAIKFLRLSMPTKASEYMISGTPVLVYAPKETAVSKFFSQNDCGYCLTSQSQEEITKAIQFLISNEEYRKRICYNAVNLAKERFGAEKVRKEFQNMLLDITDK